MADISIFVRHWPLGAAIIGGAMAYGSLKTDVSDLKYGQTSYHQDHDLIVKLDEQNKEQSKQLDTIQTDIKELLRLRRDQAK